MKPQVLVIVAHPDDEILWMGGTLIRNKDIWNTKVVCLTRKSDADRYPKFLKVIETLGVKGFIYDLDDETKDPLNQQEIIKTIQEYSNEEYDLLFTHGENGESGHQRHLDVHKAVKEMLERGDLKSKEVFFFSYIPKTNDYQGYCEYNLSADKLIKLNRDELTLKRKLAIDVYGYDRGGIGFEENSAGPIEAFDQYKDESINSISLSSRT
ncbi:MAG: PIG-L family deacetylase [archaeon]